MTVPPGCAEVFPGNSIDASSYPAFIRDNDIQRGIIVADKGFPPSRIKDELSERPDLHFLTPIKRNDKRISDNEMLSFDGVLEGIDAHIVYKKKQIKGGRFLYSFKDARKAAKEEATYLANAKRKNTFSPEKYAVKKDLFGVIVLESDQDLEPKVAYTCYEDRWLLELVFKRYKSDECLDQMSYGDLMEDLSSAWRRTDAPADPSTDDGYWVHTLKTVFEELEALGLSKPVPKPEPKKRGRKPKPKDQTDLKPKRPRGRPRKDANPSAGDV